MILGPNPNYEVFNEDIEIRLKELGERIGTSLPAGWGFSLMLFDFNQGSDGSLFYISNANREDMLNMLKEFIRRQDNPPSPLPPE